MYVLCDAPYVTFFFFNDTATTEIYTLPYTTLFRSVRGRRTRRASSSAGPTGRTRPPIPSRDACSAVARRPRPPRSEEHTSELQSRQYLVCRLLLEKKKQTHTPTVYTLQ